MIRTGNLIADDAPSRQGGLSMGATILKRDDRIVLGSKQDNVLIQQLPRDRRSCDFLQRRGYPPVAQRVIALQRDVHLLSSRAPAV
jgi:hypothetical protein